MAASTDGRPRWLVSADFEQVVCVRDRSSKVAQLPTPRPPIRGHLRRRRQQVLVALQRSDGGAAGRAGDETAQAGHRRGPVEQQASAPAPAIAGQRR
jgi:hypothetical protein